MTYERSKQSALITWDFEIAYDTMMARYGHAGDTYYKQYTPGTIIDDELYPPRPIPRAVYELARRAWERSRGKAAG